MNKKQEKKKQVFLKINELKIMMDLNLGQKEPELFQYSVLSHPELENADILKGKTYKLPFFTNMTLYPESLIRNMTYPLKVQFFFDRDIFNKTLLSNLNNLVDLNVMDPDQLEEEKAKMAANEKENIMIMLNAMFPLHGSMNSVLRSSYDHNIMEGYNTRIIKDLDIMNVFDIAGVFSYFNIMNVDKNATYLKLSKGGPYMVKSIVWENDMVNHPVYNKFITDYINVLGTIRSDVGTINREIQKYEGDMRKMFNDVDTEYIIKSLKDQLDSAKSSRSSEGNTSFQINSVITLYTTLGSLKQKDVATSDPKFICNTAFKINNILSNLKVSLGNETEDMNKFYKTCVKLEAAYRVQKLLSDGLIYSVSNEQVDETTGEKKDKPKSEQDIIGALKSSAFSQYTNNNTKLANTISTIYPPNRKTSNTKLLEMLKKKKTGSWTDKDSNDEKEAIENMYDKYFSNSPLNISKAVFSDYIYTGVDTIGGKSDSGSTGEEYSEIYVRIDVLDKEKYKNTRGKSCLVASDDLVNTYKHLEVANSEIPLNSAFRLYDINSISNAVQNVKETAEQKGGLTNKGRLVNRGGYTYKRSSVKSSSKRSNSKHTRRHTNKV